MTASIMIKVLTLICTLQYQKSCNLYRANHAISECTQFIESLPCWVVFAGSPQLADWIEANNYYGMWIVKGQSCWSFYEAWVVYCALLIAIEWSMQWTTQPYSQSVENPFWYQISLGCSYFFRRQICLIFCTEQGSYTALLCAQFQKDFYNWIGCHRKMRFSKILV